MILLKPEGITQNMLYAEFTVIAYLCNVFAIDPIIRKVHDALDREIDKAFGAVRKPTTEHQPP